ncbi:MAG: murein biosynthesis integral membrane protein MurJ [Candidatus Paceibacterota bacterium]
MLIHKKQGLAEATILITVISILSNVIGYLREVLIAKNFGASGETDAFLVAMIIPAMLTGVIANGLNTLLVPFYVEKNEKDPGAAKSFVNQMFYLSAGLFLLISLAIFVFAPFFVKIVAPGFEGNNLDLAAEITRYLVPMGFAMVFIGFFTGIYSAQKNFLFPAAVAVVGNGVIVLSIIIFTPYFGINSWTIGQLVYSISSFFVLFGVLWHKDKLFRSFSYKSIDWNEIRRFSWLVLPLMLSSSIIILNQIADKVAGSFLKEGSIAILNFAQRVYGIPLNLLAMPLITAVYPTFSSLTINNDESYLAVLKKALVLSWYMLIPVSMILIVMPEPIVKILFERGAFTAEETRLTALSVSYYSIGLFAYATNYFMVYLLYSLKNTKVPLIIGFVCVAVNITGNLILSRIMGVAGIALATAISSIIGLALYRFSPLRRCFKKDFIGIMVRELLRITLASALVGALIMPLRSFLLPDIDADMLFFRFVIIISVSLVFYLALSRVLKLEGYGILAEYAARTLNRR